MDIGYKEEEPNVVEIDQDTSLYLKRPLTDLVQEQIDKGYHVIEEYHHPAVGKVVVLQKD